MLHVMPLRFGIRICKATADLHAPPVVTIILFLAVGLYLLKGVHFAAARLQGRDSTAGLR